MIVLRPAFQLCGSSFGAEIVGSDLQKFQTDSTKSHHCPQSASSCYGHTLLESLDVAPSCVCVCCLVGARLCLLICPISLGMLGPCCQAWHCCKPSILWFYGTQECRLQVTAATILCACSWTSSFAQDFRESFLTLSSALLEEKFFQVCTCIVLWVAKGTECLCGVRSGSLSNISKSDVEVWGPYG